MKIGIDGGGLCAEPENRFGNYVVSENIIGGLIRQNKKEELVIYCFCDSPTSPAATLGVKSNLKNKGFRIVNYTRVGFSRFWLSYFNNLISNDVYLALNQYIPRLMKARTIVFSHGLSFMFYPQFYPDSYFKMKKQIDDMAKRSEYIIVSSQRVKDEWLTFYPKQKNIVVLPFGIPYDLQNQKSKLKNQNDISKIQNNENYFPTHSKLNTLRLRSGRAKYFLYVGMNHVIKNIDFIIESFNKVYGDRKDVYLYLVGIGNTRLRQDFGGQGGVRVIKYCDRQMLKELYRNAQALVTASHYESFNLPVLEALACNCPVIGLSSAIIPELRHYVNVAYNKSEFMELLLAVVGNLPSLRCGKSMIAESKVKLTKQFNWQKYTEELQKLMI